jgi:hypothetical protein
MIDTTNYKIFEELKDFEGNYETESLEKIDGLKRSQHKVIKMCEYYSDSKYMGYYLGNCEPNGRAIPFNNIVNYRVTLAKTATDLDMKDINTVSDNPKYQVHSMLLNREIYEWMKVNEFSKTLNEMGYTRPKYGGYLIKRVEEGKDMKVQVVRWTNVKTDQNDIMAGPIVELHHMSPVQINKKKYVWSNVQDVLKAHKSIKAKDRPSVIDVKEITGEFPLSVFKDSQDKDSTEKDKYTYSLQRYFVCSIDGKDYLMDAMELSGELSDYYEYLSWEDNGYGLGRGVIEDSEEAQVWTNDAVIEEHKAMMLAGRVGIKTNSKKLGNSVLEHDHGKIYELAKDEDMNSFSLAPTALGQYQSIIERWRMQADNVTSSFNSITGEQPPSGTPYSQTALLNQVASKPFDYKREEWGIHLTKIFDKWVLPHVIKGLKKKHILVSEFSDTELEMIDESFAIYNSNKEIVEELLKGNQVSPMQQGGMIAGYKQHIKKSGKKRFLEIPDDYFNDIEYKVTVVTTGEQKNKAATLQSLSEILKTVQASFNPNTGEYGLLTDPTLSKIFAEIVEMAGSGISPISLGLGKSGTKQVAQGLTMPPSPVQPLPSSPALNQATV